VKITPKTMSFRDYFHEPPSSMANYSRSTMLYGSHHGEWYARPLGPAGKAGFTGLYLPSQWRHGNVLTFVKT